MLHCLQLLLVARSMNHSSGNRPKVWPKSLELLLGLALAISRVGFAQLQAERARGRTASRETPEMHLGAGYEDLRSSRYKAAVREFRAALALDPKLVLQARFPLAVSLFELHQADEARREFEAVRREAGDRPGINYYLGRLDLTEGRLNAAILELNKAAATPPFPDTAYWLGDAYLKQRDLASAEKWLLKAARISPRDAIVQYQLGSLYSQAGRKQEAREAYARSERWRQRDAEVDRLRTNCSQKLGQASLDEARPVCDLLFDPGDGERLTILGTLYGNYGDYQDALKPLRRAAELSPNSPQMQYNLALAYFQLKRYQEAREPLERAVERWPDLFPLSALLGAVLRNLGEELPAYQALHHAHELNPQDAAVAGSLYEVSLSLAERSRASKSKQYTAALRYLGEAARLRPKEPEPHRLLAEIYDVTGRSREAAEERREIERLTDSARPH